MMMYVELMRSYFSASSFPSLFQSVTSHNYIKSFRSCLDVVVLKKHSIKKL
jgi:hypothetical protein